MPCLKTQVLISKWPLPKSTTCFSKQAYAFIDIEQSVWSETKSRSVWETIEYEKKVAIVFYGYSSCFLWITRCRLPQIVFSICIPALLWPSQIHSPRAHLLKIVLVSGNNYSGDIGIGCHAENPSYSCLTRVSYKCIHVQARLSNNIRINAT